eukprot:1157976-Pelagomonas_calceolata.AAC.5
MVALLQADLAAARAEAERSGAAATEASSNCEEAEGRVSELQDRCMGCKTRCVSCKTDREGSYVVEGCGEGTVDKTMVSKKDAAGYWRAALPGTTHMDRFMP